MGSMLKLNQNGGDPAVLAMQALVWSLSDDARANRLLTLTGLTPGALRDGAAQSELQSAVLAFLESHEPDLIACAAAIGVNPAALVAARRELEGHAAYD